MAIEIQAEDLDGALSGEPVSIAIVERRAPLRIMSEAGGAGDRVMERDIAGEVPISLAFNGMAHAVMMVTPTELEDFVYGFALTQEIIGHAGEIESVELLTLPIGYLAQISIPQVPAALHNSCVHFIVARCAG